MTHGYPEKDWSVEAAEEWLRQSVDEGATCPVCHQHAKVYKRTIHRTMARDLIKMWHHAGREWFRIPDVAPLGDNAKFAYWGILIKGEGVREDGSDRTGWWRFSEVGEAFVKGHILLHKYARVYDGRLLNLTGERIGIRECLGDKFNYDELMER